MDHIFDECTIYPRAVNRLAFGGIMPVRISRLDFVEACLMLSTPLPVEWAALERQHHLWPPLPALRHHQPTQIPVVPVRCCQFNSIVLPFCANVLQSRRGLFASRLFICLFVCGSASASTSHCHPSTFQSIAYHPISSHLRIEPSTVACL